MKRWAAVGLIVTAGAAGAQNTGSAGGAASDRVLRAFEACRQITASDERLACFDKTTAELARAVAAKEVRIVDSADIGRARRSLFGFALPNIALLDGGARGDAPGFVEINSTVRSAASAENGRARIVLAEEGDPVWQTTDPMTFPPRAGAKVRIRKGALGNYFLNVDGRTVRGMRVR